MSEDDRLTQIMRNHPPDYSGAWCLHCNRAYPCDIAIVLNTLTDAQRQLADKTEHAERWMASSGAWQQRYIELQDQLAASREMYRLESEEAEALNIFTLDIERRLADATSAREQAEADRDVLISLAVRRICQAPMAGGVGQQSLSP